MVSFIDIMANTWRDDLKKIFGNASFFSLTMDGSQPRKTGFKKELVYGKVVVRDKPVELLLKCIHINDFGGTADDLKRAIDTLMEECGISTMYENRLVSGCADGAINFGKYNGVTTQMKHTRFLASYSLCKP